MIKILAVLFLLLPIVLSAQIEKNYDKDAYIECSSFDCGWLETRPLPFEHSLSFSMAYTESSIEDLGIGGGINLTYSYYPWYIVDGLNLNYLASVDILNSEGQPTYIYSGGTAFTIRFANPHYLHLTMSFITRIAYVDAPSYTIEENGEERSVKAKKAGAGADITFGIGKQNIVMEAFAGVINTKDVIYQKYGLQLKVLF